MEDAARLMQYNQIRRLVVLDRRDHLAGVLSMGDWAISFDFYSANISEKLAGLVAANSSRNKDDATLIAVWHSVVDQSKRTVYEDCDDAGTDFRSADLSPIEMVEFIKADLIAKITEKENDAVNALLDYSDKFGLRFARDFLSSFLSLVIKQGTDRQLVARIRDLIRKAH